MRQQLHILIRGQATRRPFRLRISPFVVPLIAMGLFAIAGCGPRSDRLAISGKVLLNGEPLSGGSIHFTSLGEKKLTSGAMIENGEYHIPQEKGLLPGDYHLEISATGYRFAAGHDRRFADSARTNPP